MKSKREFTEFLDEEIARLGRQRQQLIDLRRLYEPKEEVLPEAPAAMAVSTEDMIVKIVENAHLLVSREEIRAQVQQDFGVAPEDFDEVLEKALQRATRIQNAGGRRPKIRKRKLLQDPQVATNCTPETNFCLGPPPRQNKHLPSSLTFLPPKPWLFVCFRLTRRHQERTSAAVSFEPAEADAVHFQKFLCLCFRSAHGSSCRPQTQSLFSASG